MRPGISAVNASRPPVLNAFAELGLLALSVILFSLTFPNLINTWGFGPLGYVAILPMLVVINRTTWPRVFFYGILTGFVTYLVFNYWLGAYHPMAVLIVPVIYAGYYFFVFPALKAARDLFPNKGWIVQLAVWLAYEYLRTQGFLGYPYGIIGYSQYLFTQLTGLAEITGVWGLSALVAFPSVYLAWKTTELKKNIPSALKKTFAQRTTDFAQSLGAYIARRKIGPIVWIVCMAGAIAFGIARTQDYSSAPTKRLVLVQQNVDPWIGGLSAYRESFHRSQRQTDLALANTKDVDLIVWSETSFVPAIEYHYRYRDDPDRFELVKELKDYMDTLPAPVLLGNGNAEAYINQDGERDRKDYNSALLYEGRELKYIYKKNRLVPFTEHFPYRGIMTWLYDMLVAADTSFWEEGTELTLMHAAGFTFSTPICFEDSFGYLNRDMVNLGAQMIVNITNDSWSKSVPAMMQHMAMATFRAIENRRTVVRSSNGGMSVLIDANGKVLRMNEPFTESYIVVDAPLFEGPMTVYRQIGDTPVIAIAYGTPLLLILTALVKLVLFVVRRRKSA